jgi:pyroglutamyl-peptidase
MTRSILVTGFEAFGGCSVNPSMLIAQALAHQDIAGLTVLGEVLPVIHSASGERVIELVSRHQPGVVLCFGQGSPEQTGLRIERLAANIRDYPIPDNAGHQATGESVIAGAPAAYFASLPVVALRDRVRAAGVPCRVSNSAGAFLCNEVFFATLHALASTHPRIPAGFVHLPLLPEQVAALDDPGPSMALETMLRGARAAIEATAAFLCTHDDLAAAAPGRGSVTGQ